MRGIRLILVVQLWLWRPVDRAVPGYLELSVLPWPAQSNALRTAVAPATPNTRALQMVVVEAPLPLMLLLRHPTHFAAT